MIKLKSWAATASLILIILCFHFAGWALAAPLGWKLWVGVIGIFATILATIVVASVGKED